MAKKKTKQGTIDEIADLLERIEKAEEAVAVAEADVEDAREEVKTAKGVWHSRVKDLRELIRTRKRWAEEAKRQPLLRQQAATNGSGSANHDDAAPSDDQHAATSAAWREYDIRELSLKPSTEKALRAKGIETLGSLSDLMEKHGTWWPREIPGVGDAAAERVSDAFAAFWAAHPEFTAEPSEQQDGEQGLEPAETEA